MSTHATEAPATPLLDVGTVEVDRLLECFRVLECFRRAAVEEARAIAGACPEECVWRARAFLVLAPTRDELAGILSNLARELGSLIEGSPERRSQLEPLRLRAETLRDAVQPRPIGASCASTGP